MADMRLFYHVIIAVCLSVCWVFDFRPMRGLRDPILSIEGGLLQKRCSLSCLVFFQLFEKACGWRRWKLRRVLGIPFSVFSSSFLFHLLCLRSDFDFCHFLTCFLFLLSAHTMLPAFPVVSNSSGSFVLVLFFCCANLICLICFFSLLPLSILMFMR